MQNEKKSSQIFIKVCASLVIVALALSALVQLYPEALLLIVPRLHSRSAYCSRWQAMRDARVEQRQEADAEEIARASHLVRSESGLALWATPQGEYWVLASDAKVLPILLAQEKRDIYGGKDWGVRAGDIVLDCGAYVGTWARQALDRGAKLVVEIEPTPESVECIRRNLAKEIATGRAVIVAKGIWDSEGALKFFENPHNTAGNSFLANYDDGQAVSVPVTTVDKLVSDLRLPRVDFIKADIKGATGRLLRGGRGVIARDRPRLAFSMEEPMDDAGGTAALVRQILPGYEMKCGPCLVSSGEIFTDVLFFR
ncbi:MAG: FkbM family methyltransferase [Bryobacteraceae bacterium]